MTKIKFTFIIVAVLTLFNVQAQNKKIERADKSFRNFDYKKAINQYERIIASGIQEPKIYLNLGDANYHTANYTEAAKWYATFAESTDALDIEHLYRYASSLRAVKDFDGSNTVFKKLQALNKSVSVEEMGNYMAAIREQSGSFEIQTLNINSSASDFAPAFRIDGIVFSSARDTSGISKQIHGWNKKRFLNLHTATDPSDEGFGRVQKFSSVLNTKLHESSTAFTKDGNTVYFTRNKEKGNNFGRDAQGISRLNLFRAKFIDGAWTNVEKLPFNVEGKSVAHPALNENEDKLYFASDIDGTEGQSDIFVVDINADGSFGQPKNLGKNINTGARETFPFVSKDDILYFASDGHPGLGGLDIFAVDLKHMDTSKIVNLGEPLNSAADDFSFIMNAATKRGYFASNREGGMGDDDIYALTEMKPIDTRCFANLAGVVKNKKSGQVIPNATVTLVDNTGKTITKGQSDPKGVFTLLAECNHDDYVIIATKNNYQKDEKTVSTASENIANLSLFLTLIDTGAPLGTDLAKYLKIAPIYFDLNKSYIRKDAQAILEKVINYLNAYPNAKIEVRSHTDSRATKKYNTELSEKRAKATMAYLITKGINPNRISGVGFGESQLTNKCADGVKCSKSEHQKNRRSEFILVE